MLDPNLKLRHLRCFLEVARLGSLSAAAQALNVSQPAASKTIRELEEILGTSLFSRASRRLTLTPAGRVFQQSAGSAMVELRRGQDLLRGGALERPKIAVGALPSASTDLLPRACLAFREEWPDCQIRISTGPNWLLMSQLREGDLDMVVGRMASVAVMDGLTFRQLYSEKVGAYVRADHPLLRDPSPVAALIGYPLMLPPSGAVISPVVRAFLSRQGIDNPAAAFENVSHDIGRRIVAESDVVWFISQGVVREDVDDGLLVPLSLPTELLGGPVGISMRDNADWPMEQKHLMEALVAEATRMTAGNGPFGASDQ